MNFPTATKMTAFFAGFSATVLAGLLDIFKFHELTVQNPDSPGIFLFVLAYFFATVLVLVIDVRNIAPKELKTKIPLVYFPTNREGVNLLLRVWGRILVWFLGATTGVSLLLLFEYFA
jgi:hypothetical protein